MKPLKVTAILASPIAGSVPMLDGIVAYEAYFRQGKSIKLASRKSDPIEPWTGEDLPILSRPCNGILVPCTSSPIYLDSFAYEERISKRFGAENALLLREDERKTIDTASGAFKSAWVPLFTLPAKEVVWFVVGSRRKLLKVLKHIDAIGAKRSCGYGRIQEWRVEVINEDHSWVSNRVLMRPLPFSEELAQLDGARIDFGAVQPPYWHPARFMKRVVPC